MRASRLAVGSLLVLGAGCASFQFNLAVNSTALVLEKGSSSLDREADVDLARAALPGTIKTIDSFLAAAPEHPIFLALTAQAYTQYAFGFLEDDIESMPKDTPERKRLITRATELYDRAMDIGLRLAELDKKGIRAAIKGDIPTVEAEAKKLSKKAAPGLYWAGLAMGSAINLHRDDIDRVADLPKAKILLTRAHDLDPEYFNHGAALGLAVFNASQGKAVGGNPDEARKLFDEVIGATQGKYLMAKVLFARFYGAVTLDRELFEKTLKEVLDTPASVMPEQRLANELARRRAARYLAQAEDLF